MLENRYEKFNRIILGIDSIFRTIKMSRKTILAVVLAALSLTTTGLAFAAASYGGDDSQSRLEDILKTVGKGWQLKSNGGLLYIHPEDKRYWISLSGVLRFDETYFSGSARDRAPYPVASGSPGTGFQSGASIRRTEVDIVGGIGPDWNYTIGLGFGGGKNGSHFSFADTWLAYSGFCENVELFVGRHSGNWFGLENSTSTSWYPFLERSMQANAFYPGDGMGLLVDAWWTDVGFTALALQPDQDVRVSAKSDRWLGLTAITYAPIHESGNVWHFGLSLAYHNRNGSDVNNTLSLSSYPSARARNVEKSVNTGNLLVKRIKQANIEAARQWGPLLVQGEYSQAYLDSAGMTGRGQFSGWSFIGQYMLTGEVHDYDVRDGNFGGIEVCSPYGAFEVAGRYDFVNLNNKNIQGGAQHDVTLGLNWYVNNNVRVAFNYINANILPPSYAPKRHLDIFAARLQVKFK